MEPLNNGHVGDEHFVHCSEVVHSSGVSVIRGSTVFTSHQFMLVTKSLYFVQFFQMGTAFAMKGNIQIWDVGPISMATQTPPTPRLSLTVAHEFGVVRQLKWCPSGCYDNDDNDDEGDESWGRVGLLAVASSDGFARIIW